MFVPHIEHMLYQMPHVFCFLTSKLVRLHPDQICFHILFTIFYGNKVDISAQIYLKTCGGFFYIFLYQYFTNPYWKNLKESIFG